MIMIALLGMIVSAVAVFLIGALERGERKRKLILLWSLPVFFLTLYLFLGTPDRPSVFAKNEPPSVRTELRGLIHREATLKIEALRNSDHPNRWLNLGLLQLILDKSDEAVESLQKAYDLDSNSHDIRKAFGAALMTQGIKIAQEEGNEARARITLERAFKIAPQDAPYWQTLKKALKENTQR